MLNESGSGPIVRLLEHLTTAPRLLHYTITSPTSVVIDDEEYDGKWVFNASFLAQDGINMDSLSVGHEDFVTALMSFADAIEEYLEDQNVDR